ncbi:MAG: ABC transporter ATP-binding protein [Patescibacteria group bacterium]
MIKIEDLTKTFDHGRIRAVDNLNLEVKDGEVFGFLGPNGAGKTTTIRMLMDFISPTEGKASIFGLDCQKDTLEIKKSVGFLAGDVKLYGKYSGEYLTSFLANLSGDYDEKWIKELTGRLEINLSRKVSDLSKGNKQKMGVLQALAHKPKLLILDEPTSGLDPLMQIEFYKIIKEMKKAGTTIFMSSHVLSEVEKVCDRVGILKNGKLIALKNIEELQNEKARVVSVYFKEGYDIKDFKLPGVEIQDSEVDHIHLTIRGEVDPLIKILAKYNLRDVSFSEAQLEDVFLKYYGEK